MKNIRSFVSMILAVCMVMSVLVFPVYATEEIPGDTTTEQPAEPEAIPAPAPITDITNEDGSPVKVACVGDSITYGYKIVSTNAETGELENVEYTYPAQLQGLLGEGYEVANFGKSSAYLLADDHPLNVKKGQGVSYKDQAEFTASVEFAPDVVIIMLGTNDIRSMLTPEANEAVKDALVDLVNTYKALESVQRVYVVSSIYTQLDYSVKMMSNGTLQDIQYQAAVESGAEYVDIFSLTKDYFDVMLHRSDRLHPNIESSAAIPEAIHALITGDEDYVAPEAPIAESGVVYVSSETKANYTNDALTPDTPTNSLPYAAGLVRNGGTIVVCGIYNLYNVNQGTHMPETYGEITITSVYGGVDYRIAENDADGNVIHKAAQINMNSGYLYLGGDTVFENIKLGSTSQSMIICQYNNVTFEDTVKCKSASGVQNPVLLAGYNVANGGATVDQVSLDGDCTITVNGGNWFYMRNGNRRNAASSTMGEIREGASLSFIINGGVFESNDWRNSNSATGMNNTYGDCSLIINGGTFESGRITAVNRVGTLPEGEEGIVTGNITLAIKDAKIACNDGVKAIHDEATNVNYKDAKIKLVRSNRYDGIANIFKGFDDVTVTDDDIVINSAEEIAAIMADSSKWKNYYVLADNIDMSGIADQTPIGNYDVPFTGYFDGAGHKISGLDVTSDSAAGLFGVVIGADIRNLTVDGKVTSTYAATDAESAKNATGNYVSTGMIAGVVLSTVEIVNCTAYGSTQGNGNVGGFIGMIYNVGPYGTVLIDGCDNYAVPTNTLGNTGGLMSRITSSGLTTTGATIRGCTNYANISSTSTDRCRVGGICAYASVTSNRVLFENCTNKGNISGINGVTTNASPDSRAFVGGFGGRWEVSSGANASILVKNCANEGNATGTMFTGGFVGFFTRSATCTADTGIYESYNAGEISVNASIAGAKYSGGIIGATNSALVVSQCSNSGEIKADVTASALVYVGGILGASTNTNASYCGTIKNCTNYGKITANSVNKTYAGGTVGAVTGPLAIYECSNSGEIKTNVTANSVVYAGGILGISANTSSLNGTIKNCANYGDITADSKGTKCAGGIIGEQYAFDLLNCYTSGKVTASDVRVVGAIVGNEQTKTNPISSTTTNCYALEGTMSKLVGTARSAVCTQTNVAFVAADAALAKASYAGFDFTDIWTVKDGEIKLDCYTTEASGDIDADGTLTNADITLAIRHLSGWDIEYRANRFDLNADGKLNNRDAIALIVKIAG